MPAGFIADELTFNGYADLYLSQSTTGNVVQDIVNQNSETGLIYHELRGMEMEVRANIMYCGVRCM